MMLIARVPAGALMPRYFGVAWLDYMRDEAVCMPMPFNLLFAFVLSIWTFVKGGHIRVCPNPRAAYFQGYRAGVQASAEPSNEWEGS